MSLAQNSNIDVSNEAFADEVRSDRLEIIWKSTIVAASFAAWIFIIAGASMANIAELIVVPWLGVVLGCLLTRYLLKREYIGLATWTYVAGLLVMIGYLMWVGDQHIRQLVPFTILIPIYVMGMMLPARALIPLMIISGFVISGLPLIKDGVDALGNEYAWLALVLSLITAFLSLQASGELYAIAEWALESYRREREGANQLYESRQQLERSFLRQKALAEELKNTNEELDEARAAAEEAKHFRGQFLANMSHELRTPLNAVIGFSDTMLNFPAMYNMVELPPEYHKDLTQINQSGQHLLNIINDILDLSKIDAGRLDLELRHVNLEPIFKGVMSTAVGLVGGKPVKLIRNTPDELPDVFGDPVRIRQVLLNLYSNAAKFTQEGSIALNLTYDYESVTISVSDTGEGIPPNDLQAIFEEFRQGSAGRKKARAGAGLGLSISKQLLSMMGGDIWAESEVGKGTTFYFTLPLAQTHDEMETATDIEPVAEAPQAES